MSSPNHRHLRRLINNHTFAVLLYHHLVCYVITLAFFLSSRICFATTHGSFAVMTSSPAVFPGLTGDLQTSAHKNVQHRTYICDLRAFRYI